MIGNGKMFISHAHDDASSCVPLLAALDAWEVDYWFDAQRLDAGHDLSERIQRALEERDIFLRICSPAAKSSYWVGLETGAFRGLLARDQKAGRTRVLINLIIDGAYIPEPFDLAYIFINATDKPQREWIAELRRALHVAQETTVMTSGQSGDRQATSQRQTKQVMPTPQQLGSVDI